MGQDLNPGTLAPEPQCLPTRDAANRPRRAHLKVTELVEHGREGGREGVGVAG